jgi:membrane protein implicated in regulation of membrane protease activity
MALRLFGLRLIPVEYDVRKHIGDNCHHEVNPMHAFVALTIGGVGAVIVGFIMIGLYHSWFLALCCLLIVTNLASLIISRFQSLQAAEEREIAHLQAYGYCETVSALFGKASAADLVAKQREYAARELWNVAFWPAAFPLATKNLPTQLDSNRRIDLTIHRELYLLWMMGLAAVAIPLLGFVTERTLESAIWTIVVYFAVGTALRVDFTTRFHNNGPFDGP